jgi:hypothetical protein
MSARRGFVITQIQLNCKTPLVSKGLLRVVSGAESELSYSKGFVREFAHLRLASVLEFVRG